VQLRDARLGDAEDLADLAQGQVLVVVERDHQLLTLRQRRDRIGQPVLELGGVEQQLRVGASGSCSVSSSETWSPDESETAHSSSSATTVELEILISGLLELVHAELELVRPSRRRWAAVQPVLELAVRALDLARAAR
jgi:hypothetical protein